MYRYYLLVIGICPALLALCATYALDLSPLVALLTAYAMSALAFAIDALVALAVRLLCPPSLADARRRIWHVHKWERSLYVRLGIRHWKDKIPEAGGLLVGFSKKRIAEPKNAAYLRRFLAEGVLAECMHALSIPAGFALLLPLFPHRLCFGLPIALINALLNLLPLLVQRYVRPFLLARLRRIEEKT